MSAIAKETLDRISGALIADERTLSPQEKELLVHLLHVAGQKSGDERSALTETISRAVGETVARRAYGLLGESITQRLVAEPMPSLVETRQRAFPEDQTMPPKPPGPMPPFPPGPRKSLVMPPQPPAPMPPGPRAATHLSSDDLSPRLLHAEILPAKCVLLDEFLSPSELKELSDYTLAHEGNFEISEVVAPGAIPAVDFDYRRSQVLMDLGNLRAIIEAKLLTALPGILPKLSCPGFARSRTEMQITASGDGDFFRCHSDNGCGEISSRQVTFVYFFHREPKPFEGGELRLYDSRWQETNYVALESSRSIVPQQNQMVLFLSSLMHELAPVQCPSGKFADSRFTVNGWVHRKRA